VTFTPPTPGSASPWSAATASAALRSLRDGLSAAVDSGCGLSRELLRRSQARPKVSQLTGGCPTGKAHVTETCEPDRPHLIVHVATTVATTADIDTMPARHAELATIGLLPDEHLVDAGYVSVDGMLAARADHGVELVGPLPPDSGWQARDEGGFDLARFHIDWDQRQVTCPNGKTARNWRQGTTATACRSCR
jgi:hypothetical protein